VQILLWLLIPVAGIVIGAVWVWWRSRPRRTPDAAEGMAEMYRIRQAMNQPMPDIYRRRNNVTIEHHTQPVDLDESSVTIQQDAGQPSDATFRKSA